MEEAKHEFLRRFGEDYGYPNSPKGIDEMRASEFKRVEGTVYLDHAGTTLYSETQMEAVAKDLTSNVYGNPHSQSESSLATSDIINAARQQVLDYFNASPKDYKCIFTSGATAALKLVGESFPWSRESCYMYTVENHNSVLGIREYALNQGATALAIDIEDAEHSNEQYETHASSIQFLKRPVQRRAEAESLSVPVNKTSLGNGCHLFAFPSECNFSGMKFSLDLVKTVKEDAGKILGGSIYSRGHWMVLIDAAKGCATEPPDLARYPADFVALSFYKIFGYPTGLGALLVRTEAAKMLNRRYFSGGTVSASISDIDFVKRREPIEQLFEDGTQSFLSIASIRHGFKIIDTLTISAIARHTSSLATYVRSMMLELKHENGADVCTFYGRNIAKVLSSDMGPTVAFNLRRADGSWFGYREVEKLASLFGIQLRTGCFCNPGACAKYLGLSHSDLLSNIEAGHICWDDNDVLNGKPTGAVRISFGYMSTFEDAEKFVRFIATYFVSEKRIFGSGYPRMKMDPLLDIGGRHLAGCIRLKSITIYPVKSCAGFSAHSWPLSSIGLKYDREWLLKGPNGEVLTQKKVPELCHIHTFIDLKQGNLYLESPRCNVKLRISLQQNSSLREEMDVYGHRYEVQNYDDEVNMWFSKAIARPCTFVRCLGTQSSYCMRKGGSGVCRGTRSKLNFVNEAQLLLISEGSVGDLNNQISSKIQKANSSSDQPMLIDAMRFRPNLVISGAEPYAEDDWTSLRIEKAQFSSLGGCNRCEMINLDHQAGQVRKSKEPLATLASYRRVKGKILFGILLRCEDSITEVGEEEKYNEGKWLQVGQQAYPSVG